MGLIARMRNGSGSKIGDGNEHSTAHKIDCMKKKVMYVKKKPGLLGAHSA